MEIVLKIAMAMSKREYQELLSNMIISIIGLVNTPPPPSKEKSDSSQEFVVPCVRR